MKDETKERIKEEVVIFGLRRLSIEYNIQELRRAFPFHAVFFHNEGLVAFKNQRRIVTGLGQSLIPRIAKLIASESYQKVFLNHRIEGKADQGMIRCVQDIINLLREGERSPDSKREWNEILSAKSGKLIHHQVIADLYIEDFKPGPLFIEIKSPRPNIDVCTESKRKMLFFRIIKYVESEKEARAYLGFWYNPYIKPELYSHSPTWRIMARDEVLIGEEMWDMIGGKGTYEELIEILKEAEEKLKRTLRRQDVL